MNERPPLFAFVVARGVTTAVLLGLILGVTGYLRRAATFDAFVAGSALTGIFLGLSATPLALVERFAAKRATSFDSVLGWAGLATMAAMPFLVLASLQAAYASAIVNGQDISAAAAEALKAAREMRTDPDHIVRLLPVAIGLGMASFVRLSGPNTTFAWACVIVVALGSSVVLYELQRERFDSALPFPGNFVFAVLAPWVAELGDELALRIRREERATEPAA